MTNYEWAAKITAAKILWVFCLLAFSVFSANAQSINQNAPTPIAANEISGVIAARDLGDARLTTFFYTFEGVQGDVFINVVTTNFNGDIDVFTADNLRPLAKITAYADSSNNETGRVIYLRQPVKLILRIQGRTPNDDAATFRMKFAGSFAPSTAIAETAVAPEVKSNNESDVRVNSVGTIIEIKPKPTLTPKAVVAKVEKPIREKKPKATPEKIAESTTDKPATEIEKADIPPKKSIAESEAKTTEIKGIETKQVKADELTAEKEAEKAKTVETNQPPVTALDDETARKEPEKPAMPEIEKAAAEEKTAEPPENKNAVKAETFKGKKKSSSIQPIPAAALENINLIIVFKDGSKIERPMSEILKVGVDKGVLTIISKTGAVGRYSILDVEKMTIQ